MDAAPWERLRTAQADKALQQIRVCLVAEHGLRASVLYGEPAGPAAPGSAQCAWFLPTTLVAYQLATRRLQTFLFRGLGDVRVPGVRPAVNLIAHATNATQSGKLLRTLEWLSANGCTPQALPDALWLRIAALLNQEKYGVRQLHRLLETQQ